MIRLRKIIFFIYPAAIFSIAIYLSFIQGARAGRVKVLTLSQDQPGKVVLALGKATAISFPVKPEHLVPGAPGSVAINFLGNDITVNPNARDPGNLLVYTKSGRYVIVFELGSGGNYDDVVKIHFGNEGTPLRLMEDSYHVENLKVALKAKSKAGKDSVLDIPVFVTGNGTQLRSPELFDAFKETKKLRCPGCVVSSKESSLQVSCARPIQDLKCEAAPFKEVLLRRSGP